MEDNRSTLQPSGFRARSSADLAPTPGLVRVFGAGAAMAVALPFEGGALELGRGAAALGEAQDPRMSRRHARIRFDGQRFWVDDLGSQNGTFVDGEPLPSGEPRELRCVLRLGDSLFAPSTDLGPLARLGVATVEGFVRGPTMQQRLAETARAAELGLSLHIRGESGTGKEGIARAFHDRGPRQAGPFVPVNCAAIPQAIAERLLFGAKRGAYSGADADAPGYLQASEGGTLFLDEVAELDLQVQAKLLRALETREVLALGAAKPRKVDFAFCSASHRDLRTQVSEGRLREDLYFRLGRPEVVLPPLRRRPEEVAFLLEAEARRVTPGLALHVSLVETCLLRPWPGNVRELLVEARGAAQTALLHGAERIEVDHLGQGAGSAFEPAGPPPSPSHAPSYASAAPPPSHLATPPGATAAALPSPAALPPGAAIVSPHAAPAPATTPPPAFPPPTAPPASTRAAIAPSERKGHRPMPSRAPPLADEERARIEAALRQQGGNVTATARALGMHRTHLRRLMDRHHLDAPPDGGEPGDS